MAFSLNISKGRQILRVCKIVNNLQTKQSHWFPALKPGPYPKTKEEREAAAKKYNLLPEEYEPFPEEESYGDYPKLPLVSVDNQDPYHNWDYPNLRRDFRDPVPKEVMLMLPYVTSTKEDEFERKNGFVFIACMVLLFSVLHFLSQIKLVTPVASKQLVKEGVTHYTFEIDEAFKEYFTATVIIVLIRWLF